jgi:Flagellar biosynthesis protein, FliO
MSPHRAAAAWCRVATLMLCMLLAMASFSPMVRAAAATESAAPAVELSPAESQKIPSDIPLRRDTASDAANPAATVWPTTAVLLGLAALLGWSLRRKRLGKSAAASVPGSRHHPMWPMPIGRWLAGSATAPVQVLSNQRLTPRHSVHLIQWQGRTYLLGCAEHHVTVIDSAPLADGTVPQPDLPKP